MIKIYLRFGVLIVLLLLTAGCTFSNNNQKSTNTSDVSNTNDVSNGNKVDEEVSEKQKQLSAFLPEGYIIFEEIYGDLNKDGLEDCILIIKGTDKNNVIEDEYRGKLDRNRRGIIVLFNKNGHYELAVKNYDCFSSENEDGGVYYAPELNVSIEKGKLFVEYSHGRYGYWQYTFRYRNSDFELIGYDANSCRGPVVECITSINFLTKKKQINVNTNEDADSGEEIFKETWENIEVEKLIKLSEIKDFDELYFS